MTIPTNRLEAIEARLASAKNADGDYDPRLYGDRGDPSAPSDLAWALARIRELAIEFEKDSIAYKSMKARAEAAESRAESLASRLAESEKAWEIGSKDRVRLKAEEIRLGARLQEEREANRVMASRLAEVERERDLLKQTSAQLCDECGWAMKFPGDGCRNCQVAARDKTIEAAREALVMTKKFMGPLGATHDPEDDGLRRIIDEVLATLPPAPEVKPRRQAWILRELPRDMRWVR